MTTLAKTNGNLFPEMPSLLNDFLSRDLLNLPLGGNGNRSLPAVNIRETHDSFELEVAAPGLRKKDFEVELDNNMLTISAQREMKDEQEEENFTRREFSYQSFRRSFHLPENKVEGDKIKAKYTDGILYVSVPKREEAKTQPARRIEIS